MDNNIFHVLVLGLGTGLAPNWVVYVSCVVNIIIIIIIFVY